MSIPNTATRNAEAPPIPPHIALPLIHNRTQRLAADTRTIQRLDPLLTVAIEGIADDLADVIAQLTPAVTP